MFFFVVCIFVATLVAAGMDTTDPIAVQALYNRVSYSGTTADTLTDVLRSAGVTPDWAQRNANQLAQASGLPVQTIYSLVNNLVLYYGAGGSFPAISPPNSNQPISGGGVPSVYYGGVPPPYQDSYRTNLQQTLDRVRLYGTTKDSLAKLLRASNLDLNLLKTNFADFVFASGLDWKDVQDVYMTLKLGDACSPNPCPTGMCIPTGTSCPGCMPYSCVNVAATPTFSEITPTRDPAALKQMLRNTPGDPRMLAQYIPVIATKSGMDVAMVTSVVTDVIANTQAAAASLGAFGLPSISPKDTILQVSAIVTTPAALFDALQRVLTSLQGSVDPSPFGALVPEIASASHLSQGQVAQVFGDLAKVARGTYVSPPTPASPFGMYSPANLSPLPPTPMVATPEQLQGLLARLGPGMDATALKAALTQSGINIPQLGTLLQQIAITTGLPTPTVSGILTQMLNANQPSPAPTSATVPPSPATPLAVEYVISALTPGMSPASVEAALMRVKDPRTIAPFRSYITSRTQLSSQVVDGIVAKVSSAVPAMYSQAAALSPPTPSLPPPPSTLPSSAAASPPAPLASSDKQILDTLTPTTPQALFFTLKQVSDPTVLNAYIDQIATATQVTAPTVQRVVAAVIQSASDSANNPTPLTPPLSPTPAPFPPTPGFATLPPTDPPTSAFNYPPTPALNFPPTPASNYPPNYSPNYPPTPASNFPPTPGFNYPSPTPFPPAPAPSMGASGSGSSDPLTFIATLPADGTAQDVYQALQSSSIAPSALSPYVQQIAARTGVTAAIAQSILDTIAKLSSSGPATAPSGSTDEFLAVSTSLRDGMTIEEVRAILEQQVSDPRSLSVNVQSIAFRTGLEDSVVGAMIQDLIKSKQQSG